jgi:hypothetical protein
VTGKRVGAVDVRYAFSMSLADPTTVSMSRIESGMIGKMSRVSKLGAKIYLCSSGAVGNGVADTKTFYLQEADTSGQPKTTKQATEWLNQIKQDHIITDVFI